MAEIPPSGPETDDVERLAEATGVVSNKWHPAIIHVLGEEGPVRFNDLKSRIGAISAKVLSDSLEDLGEAGLVERRVLTESPLRVEYALTAGGEGMVPVVRELLAWSREHLAGDQATVLVADDDPRVAGLHADWLSEDHEVETVNTAGAAVERADEATVAVLDRGLAGSDREFFGRVRDRVAGGVVALSSTEPGLDVVDLACDAYLTKPAENERLREVVDSVADLGDRERPAREYFSLEARRRAIADATSSRRRADSDAFDRLTARIETLSGRVDEEAVPEPPVTDGGTG